MTLPRSIYFDNPLSQTQLLAIRPVAVGKNPAAPAVAVVAPAVAVVAPATGVFQESRIPHADPVNNNVKVSRAVPVNIESSNKV